MHKYVEELKQSVADEEIAAYLLEFEKKVEEEIIKIGDISLEDVQVNAYFRNLVNVILAEFQSILDQILSYVRLFRLSQISALYQAEAVL